LADSASSGSDGSVPYNSWGRYLLPEEIFMAAPQLQLDAAAAAAWATITMVGGRKVEL
jgi:hypothetical protein